jgi:D-alanine-D-alanine ligase
LNKKPFNSVAVLKGGFSAEREVSLRSGAAVAGGLRAAGYVVEEIDVTSVAFRLPSKIEAVFIVLHGAFGEDGEIQNILENMKIPYTGSSPMASKLAFDKVETKKILTSRGIPTPRYEVLTALDRRTLPYPLIVKPVRQGSSIGVHRVAAEAEWGKAFNDALKYDGPVLVEEYIDGAELTVGILIDEALPIIEIRAPAGNYDYKAKYTKGVTEYLVPAPLNKKTTHLVHEVAMATFKALKADAFGRVDIRLSKEGLPYVLELNTIPGFTETSLLPKAAQVAGYNFSELCDKIMRLAKLHGACVAK